MGDESVVGFAFEEVGSGATVFGPEVLLMMEEPDGELANLPVVKPAGDA